MIDALCPYDAVKETSIPWVRQMPTHWQARRIKTLLGEIDDRTETGKETLLSLRMIAGLVDHHAYGGKPIPPDALVGFKKIQPGQMVMNRMRASTGLFGLADRPGLVSPDYAVFTARPDVNLDYLILLFKTQAMGAIFRAESKGLGTGQSGFLRLYTDRFGAVTIPYPTIGEQRLIVRFLNWHGAMTARLVHAKKQLIGLLNEQKQSIIRGAVTRGLEPGVKLKPSGVDWIGDVPAHWEVKRLRFAFRDVIGGATPSSGDERCWGGDVVWATPTDVSKSARLATSIRTLTTFGLQSCAATLVPAGSIILTCRAPVGNVSIAECVLATNQGCKALIVDERVLDGTFAYHVMCILKRELQSLAVGTTFAEISASRLKDVCLPVPPVPEQQAISAYVKGAVEQAELAIAAAQREIATIQEFRARLIADVVTGQLDVRTVAANLPDLSHEFADSAKDADELDEDDEELADEEVSVA